MNTGNDRPRRPGEPELGGRYIGCVIGVLGSLVLAALLVPLRDHVPNADMALALVIPVLLGATVGGRLAAIVSAITAVLVFDFVFTEPYLSLRISSKDDVATFVVFAIVALVAAEVGIRARRGGAAARAARGELERLYRITELAAGDASLDEVLASACTEIVALCGLVDCRYEAGGATTELPRLGRRGALEGTKLVITGDLVLPPGGVEVPVRGRGRDFGRLILYSGADTGVSLEKRLVVVTIADALGLAIAGSSDKKS